MTTMEKNRAKNREAERLLTEAGIDLNVHKTYDFRPTWQRFSVFNGRVTAVWADSHFIKIPFGTFKVIG